MAAVGEVAGQNANRYACDPKTMLEVVVVWAGAPVPRLNTAEPHHITLCRCAGASAQRPWRTDCRPATRPGCATEASFASSSLATSGRVEGLQRLVGALREAVLDEDLAFEPDARGLHVSL